MVGCCLLLSTALFVIACRPAIVDDCVAGCRPPAHLVALVSLAAGHVRRRRCHRRWQSGPVGGHEAVAEDLLVLQC